MARFIDELKRTHRCNDLRASDEGNEVVLFGWVANYRDHGGCVFIDLRDRDGITQLVFDPNLSGFGDTPKDSYQRAQALRSEWVIGIRGKVVSRGNNKNPKLATGDIEVHVIELNVFNKSDTPPFEIADSIDTGEEKRLEYRYLDLRRAPLQKTLRVRHKINQTVRNYFDSQGFLELETPFMGKYTPGGARNFLVPSRMHAGKFYALAESPQLYKQLYMVAGFDRYFQIVKCFRDEALRLDRQPEFTQIDVEMSFVNQDDIFKTMEGLIFKVWKDVLGIDLHEKYPSGRFPQMPFSESMGLYGNDKPDLRFTMPHTDITKVVVQHGGGGIPMFQPIAEKFKSGQYREDLPAEIVKALRIPAEHASKLSRAELDKLEDFVKGMGAKGLARAKIDETGQWAQSPLAKNITPEARDAINAAVGLTAGDLVFFQFGKEAMVQTVMANLRVHLAKKLGLIPESGHGGKFEFLWVINPPLFEFDEEANTWVAAHHAFTRPHDSDVDLLDKDPGKVLCYRYDLVLNGFEIGGGSIRLHDPDIQAKVFNALGISNEEAREKFGFLLDALRFGAPPHGGIAVGMDRLAMLLSGAQSLRDVIPFPKTQKGTDQMTNAPNKVEGGQLRELHIRVVEPQT
ncbi:Aspartyl-tRNA synthetase [Labilithrix luteola]|uniref:Aspartate--tRNA(Asp/Asn) ligase n=1 Tax=Labilithrix luteola TaxID=1391654 RepID=A0A0K1PTN3_9BACT|nr:aspartate--tRNA ligase [Labilithrix luteola]AKU96903.1 Aspartyl-tRNA synthetase [Labilithrix luteola]